MNARTDPAELQSAPVFASVPLDAIVASGNSLQATRRARFTKEALEQLAASIRQVGVAEPILLRPLGDVMFNIHRLPEGQFEIIAGERRWLAAKLAGLATVPAMVRAYTDEQALELQLIENLQRVDLHEMEEAEGYDALRKLKKLSAEDIGAQVGKSRSQVFARLKLLDLCPEARKAFYAGEFSASVALLIARVPGAELQQKLLKDLSGKGDFFRRSIDGDPPAFLQVQHFVQNNYMADLKGVPFKLDDAGLVAKAGACSTCPKRTGNQKDLFTEIKNPNVCTDPQCLAAKRDAFAAKLREAHEANGETVITGAAAKKIKPHDYGRTLSGGYVNPDDQDYLNGKYQTYRKALGKDLPAPKLLEDPHTRNLIPIVARDALAKALKAKGIKTGYSSGRSSDSKAAERKARIETAARMRILRAIREANRGRAFDAADTVLVAEEFFGHIGFDSRKRLVDDRMAEAGLAKPTGHDYVRKWEDKIGELPASELAALLIDAALVGECQTGSYYNTGKPKLLQATAARLGIDADKIRAQVQAEFAAWPLAKKKTAKK